MANNPRAKENLKPFKKGDDKRREGNGRPLGVKNRSTIIKKWLEVATTVKNPETGEKETATVEDKVILALLTKALKGDVSAAREILDSAYGKAQQPVEQSGELKIVWHEERTKE